jgi:hypothetical protein
MFPVRYELNSYIFCRRNSAFKGLTLVPGTAIQRMHVMSGDHGGHFMDLTNSTPASYDCFEDGGIHVNVYCLC